MTNTPVEPTEEITDPIDMPVEPVEPTEEITDPTDTPVEPVEPAPYEANLTYRHGGKDFEVPEAFKSMITDEESNNMVLSLHEKAQGLDFMKNHREQIRNEFNSYKEQATPYLQKMEDVKHFKEQGDIQSALHVAGFSTDEIVGLAVELAEKQAAKDQGHHVPDFNPAESIKIREMQRENEMYKAQFAEQQSMQAVNEFHQVAEQNAPMIQAYETQNGAGSFQTMVAHYGMDQERNGRQLTISQATNEMIQRYNLNSLVQSPVEPTPQVEVPPVATFPSVVTKKAGTASPVVKNLNSFTDLERERSEMLARRSM